MLNLSVRTRLDPEKALERARAYFVDVNGLRLVEMLAHMHATKGAAEFGISGDGIEGSGTYTPEELLRAEVDHLRADYGFELVYYALHLHPSADENAGHLMVTVRNGGPTEVTLESYELDPLVEQFAASLPRG